MGLRGVDSVSIRGWFKDFTYNEAHLLILGFYSGFVAIRPTARQEPKPSVKKELNWAANSWYWRGAYAVGYTLKMFLSLGAAFAAGLTTL